MSLSLSGRLCLSVNSARYDDRPFIMDKGSQKMYENYIEIIRRNKRRMNVIFDQIDKSIKDLA